MGHEAYFSGNNNNSEVIEILIKPNVSYVVQKYTEIIVGRIQALVLIINEKITLINLYGPNDDDQTFLDQLESSLMIILKKLS